MKEFRDVIRAFSIFTFKKKLPPEFGGERIYVTGRADARVLKPGWSGAAFDLQLVVRHFVKPGMTVWDIGANQGILAALSAHKVGPSGAVYALEADPYYADLIFRSSKRLPKSYQRINVLCAAISDTIGVMEFEISSQGHAKNRLAKFGFGDFKTEACKMVYSIRGDDLLNFWRSPDFIKMDVEGAELAALHGCTNILKEVRPIFYIEVSLQNKLAVSNLFREFDYEIYHLKGDGSLQPVDLCSFYTVAMPGALAGLTHEGL